MTAICGVTTQMASDWFSFLVRICEGNKSRANWRHCNDVWKPQINAAPASSIEGGLFLEQISMQKNAINLKCKFAFINYMY